NDEFCESWEGKDNTGIESDEIDGFVLHQNVPNPTNGMTTIDFEVPCGGMARMEIRDVFGRLLYEKETMASEGLNRTKLDVSAWSSGIYYISVEFDHHKLVKKMLIAK
ncbi:MAG: T9SS type A sorting domain-containing protein, partial [Bacteroidota bacterium]